MNTIKSDGLLQKLCDVGGAFIRLGEHGLSEAEAGGVRAARLAAVSRNTPWMMVANIGNAAVTLAAFWQSPSFPLVALWSALIAVLAGVTGRAWWRARSPRTRQHASLRGVRRAVIYASLLSGLWALLVGVFFAEASESQRLVLVALCVGMTGGGGFALATIPPAAIVFGLTMGLGAIVALSTTFPHDSAFLMIGLNLLLLYAIYFAIIVRSSLSLCSTLTARARAEISAGERRDVIGLLLNDFEENASDWLWSVDADLRLLRASPRFYDLIGRPASELVGNRFNDILPVPGARYRVKSDDHGSEGLRRQMESQKPFRDLEVYVASDGRPAIWSLTAKPVHDEAGTFVGYRGVGRDVTAAREARGRIEHMAKHDPLTDLANRVLFADDLGRATARLHRTGRSFAVLLLDLDRFKQVNDTHGHGAGDILLKAVANRLEGLVEDNDTLARFGGDEFAIIHTNPNRPGDAAGLAERIVAGLSAPFMVLDSTVRIGVSIGIACAPTDGQDADILMRNADLALYRAKSDGRERYSFFDPSLDAAARRRNLIEQELHGALANDALTLNFQPLADAATGKVGCFEALVRWNHPVLGAISPAEFIPLAEASGTITALGAWVIRKACQAACDWPAHIRVAVNLSPRQFSSPGLFSTIQKTVADTGLAPQRLELEITESLLLNSDPAIETTLIALQTLGVRIALDDFGTGYSSLSYLRKYHFDKLKIDQSFIRDIETSADSRAIVGAIIRLAHDLKISVAAEGIETEGQYALLRQLGCGEIQGYLVGRPQTADKLARFLSARPMPNFG